jgi:hypothetical protein
MAEKCPICSADIGKSEIICADCMEKVRMNEPVRREDRIRNIANTLAVLLSIFLLLKGGYALLGLESYKSLVKDLGFPVTSNALHYWNASVCILAALGYAVTSLGNYLNTEWAGKVCRFTLIFFAAGELIIQLGDISEEYILAEAIAVVCFLCAVPSLQYVMSLLGRSPAPGIGRGPVEPEKGGLT